MRNLRTRTGILSAIILFAGISAADAEVSIETVALTGDPAPGTIGRTFAFLRIPALNGLGEAIFTAALDPSDFTDREGLWVGNSDSLVSIVRQGDMAPGASGRTFTQFGQTANSNLSGDVAFVGVLDSSDRTNDFGIWVSNEGNLSLVAREGDAAPDTGGEIFGSFGVGFPVMNSSGEVAFHAQLRTSTSSDRGFWVTNAGSLFLVAREGDEAPGTDGRTFRELGFLFHRQPVLNASGEVAFGAHLDTSDFSNFRGIWAGSEESLQLISQMGDVAPGTGGRTFFSYDPPVLNASGDVAFEAVLDLSDFSNLRGIWVTNAGSLALVARQGDIAPGTLGRTFDSFSGPVLSASGEVAFAGVLDSSDFSNHRGVWMGTVDDLTLVARKGDVAPGTVGQHFDAFGVPALNACGDLVFEAVLVSTFGDRGIWAGSMDGLAKIIGTGDQLEVSPGTFRTVTHLGLFTNSGNEDGRLSSFNNVGQVTFRAIFSDGSRGIFIASPPGPVDMLTDLIDTVLIQGFNPGVENPLLDKLNAALNKLDDDNSNNDGATVSNLGDFIAIVKAKQGKNIDEVIADSLIAAADHIVCVLSS